MLAVALLIVLTAFFVASEFAIVKVRTSRINQLIEEHNKHAPAVKKVITFLDEYLSACQLGITVAALGLGWLGESTFEQLLHPLFVNLPLNEAAAHTLSFAAAFFIVTYLHVVVGELAPKAAAIQEAERFALAAAKPLIWFYRIMFPFIWILNSSARILIGFFGFKPASGQETAHSEEELRVILSESYESGEINLSEYRYVNQIFEFDDRIANEIMVPRMEIAAIEKGTALAEVVDLVQEEQFTRYPVYEGDKDNIIGLVNIKRLYTAAVSGLDAGEVVVDDYLGPIIYVLENMPIHELLLKMQKERIHMAVLLDEYGGTEGIVTAEDILEEIVGEIRDEFDQNERPPFQKISEERYLFNSKLLIEDVNDLLGIGLPEEDVDTLGGLLLFDLNEVSPGGYLESEGWRFTVKEMDGRHILSIEAKKLPADKPGTA